MSDDILHPVKSGQLNFNTVVGVIALAVIGWVGNQTAASKESLTEIKTTLPFVTQSVTKLEAQMTLLVTRSEIESRFSELAAKNAVMDKRVMALEFEKRREP